MTPANTAVLLVGLQDEYFGAEGRLRALVEDSASIARVLGNTVALLEGLAPSPARLVSTPIAFTRDYAELVEPVGLLAAIKEAGLLRRGEPGTATVAAVQRFGDRITEVQGKRGFDAFFDTGLHELLRAGDIEDVVIAGALTALCVDATARSAQALGYQVTVLSDCTLARTPFEQEFFCEQIFPLYARVADHATVIAELTGEQGVA